MGSQVAEKTGSSLESPSTPDDARLRVEIVPGRQRRDASTDDSATHSADMPFLGEQHETIVSNQRPESSERLSLDAALAHSTMNPNEMGAVLKGETLGHFLLEEFVGGGGMGVVFRATDIRLGRTVAIKILTRDRTDADTLRRFQNEAQSAARLDHENIARVYYVGEDRGLHFIVFEFIEGTNIRDLVQRQGPLPVDQAISYVLQVAEALEHASMRNVIHRDIKPSNVLVTDSGVAKLVDMGLARLHQMESDTDDLTASGVTLGTFDYISPEQARDPRTADVRSDLYSLGCTFYFMLTGRPPFPEGTVLQKLLSHSTEEPTDPRMFRPDLDEQIVQTLQRLLAKQPSHRYQQASEFIGHLLLVAERLNLEPIARHPTAWNSPRYAVFAMLQRVLPWSLPIALLLVIILVLQSIWGSSEPFEFGGPTIQLQTSQVDSPSEPSSAQESTLLRPEPRTLDSSSVDPSPIDGSVLEASDVEEPVAEKSLNGLDDRDLSMDVRPEPTSPGASADQQGKMFDDRPPRDTDPPDRAEEYVPENGESAVER
ncbi:MAG: serine/threonine protein kinase, partial [Planctomycetaceae bacterium]